MHWYQLAEFCCKLFKTFLAFRQIFSLTNSNNVWNEQTADTRLACLQYTSTFVCMMNHVQQADNFFCVDGTGCVYHHILRLVLVAMCTR